MERKEGAYLGTEIGGKWWKRYKRDRLFARGSGTYWLGDDGFYFLRYLTKTPMFIPYSAVSEVELGKWHAGRWAMGRPVLKLVWRKGDLKLSSGFVVSRDDVETMSLKVELERRIGG